MKMKKNEHQNLYDEKYIKEFMENNGIIPATEEELQGLGEPDGVNIIDEGSGEWNET